MITCTSCGTDVTGKKFCPQCGTPVHVTATPTSTPAMTTCPRCGGEVSASAAFCMHCGTALKAQVAQSQPLQQQPQYQQPQYQQQQYDPSYQQSQYNQQQYQQSQPYQQYPQSQYDPSQYQQSGQYNQYNQSGYQSPQQYQQYQQPQQYNQQQYGQPYNQYNPQYGQQQYNQGGYMQQPMTLRCPVCMAMAPIGTPNCPSCHTSLAGVVPTPANMAPQGQQGGLGGILQGNNGKMAMGALGGAAAVLGGEMLLRGIEGGIENRVEGDMGYDEYGYERHHRHHRREDEGLLGGLGDIANDLGL